MVKFRKIKPKISRRKKLILLFVLISLLFVSGGYAIINSNVSFLGTLFMNKFKNSPVIQNFVKDDATKFRSSEYKDNIKNIFLSDTIDEPENVVTSWNLGINERNNVMGYLVTNSSDSTMYDLYIQGDDGLIANPDSKYLFWGLTNLETINNLKILDTSNVTDMSYMFYGSSKLTGLDFGSFNTSNVTSMSNMFRGCSNLTDLDLSKFDTRNVTYMSNMFYECSGLLDINLSKFDTRNVINMSSMFYGCYGLLNLDLSSFDTSNVTSMSSMIGSYLFSNDLMSLKSVNFGEKWNTSKVKSMMNMFGGCGNLTNLDVSKFDTSNVTSMMSMFRNCSSITFLDVTKFNTSKVTTFTSMFSGCSSLTTLDVSKFNTSKATSLGLMFNGCSSLENLDVSYFDTSKVKSMSSMFSRCTSLISLDLINFNTNNVTDMSNMFSRCICLSSLDLSNFNTSNVTNMSSMFYGCENLLMLDVSSFDTSNVTNMKFMFGGDGGSNNIPMKLTEIKFGDNFNTSKVTNMQAMFQLCCSLTSLDLSGFDTSNVTDMSYMFAANENIKVIYVGLNWNVANVTESSVMFTRCYKLVGQNNILFNSSNVDATMANYDTGYLTLKCFASDLKRLAASDTVIKDDETADHNMRYTGISPNNYVMFNGEEWRVIGSFNNVDDGTGKKAPRVKIIKSESIGDKQWHTSSANIWKSASLNTELQTLSYTTNSMVDNAVWYLGDPGGPYNYTTAQAYTFERGTTVVSGNDVEWTGKVGLMYPSDYGYASSGCKDGTQPIYKYNGLPCYTTDWLFLNNGSHEWLLNPFYGYDANARYLNSGGFVAGGSLGTNVNKSYAVRPVVYLKAEVKCTNCSDASAGTKSNPFTVSLN